MTAKEQAQLCPAVAAPKAIQTDAGRQRTLFSSITVAKKFDHGYYSFVRMNGWHLVVSQ
jgi:hypothetical protein